MKRDKSCINSDVPSDLLPDILSYLPVNDLLRFRSVSKLWKSIIGDPSFCSLHLKRCPNNTKNPCLLFWEEHRTQRTLRNSDHWVLRRSKTYWKAATEMKFPGYWKKEWLICSSLDGLIVLVRDGYMVNQKDSIIVWNPSIGKSIYLQQPSSPWMQPCDDVRVSLALLFESSSNDYKVIMIRYLYEHKSISAPLFDLFSLKSRSWVRVVVDNHNSVTLGIKFDYNSASIGGFAYWIGSNKCIRSPDEDVKGRLISFDLRSNMFSSMLLPMESNKTWQRKKFIVLQDSTLGLLAQFPSDIIRIWGMERSSTFDGCWSVRYQIQPEIPAHGIFMEDTFFVPIQKQKRNTLLWGCKTLSSYDLDIDEFKHVMKNYLYTPKYIAPYVESLLLLENVANPELDSAEP